MSKAFDKIMAGAEDALSYAQGDAVVHVVHAVRVVDARAIGYGQN
jgi:hypothetical protein